MKKITPNTEFHKEIDRIVGSMRVRGILPGPLGLHPTVTHLRQDSPVSQPAAAQPLRGPVGISSFSGVEDWVQRTTEAANQLWDGFTDSFSLTFAERVRNWRDHFPDPIDEAISRDLWDATLNSLQTHIDEPRLVIPNIVTLVDFNLRSSENRMWVLNLEDSTVMHHVLVAHGKGIEDSNTHNRGEVCRHVGNMRHSHLSSVGAFTTALSSRNTTAGSRGHSATRIALAVHGLDTTNNNAFGRAILFHGAWYVRPTGAGKSWGCFATQEHVNAVIIPAIVGGSFVYARKA
jgi:hypothetical protein